MVLLWLRDIEFRVGQDILQLIRSNILICLDLPRLRTYT